MVERCAECGSQDLLPSESHIRLTAEGKPLARPVPALRCALCGRAYPAGEDVPMDRRASADRTWPPED